MNVYDIAVVAIMLFFILLGYWRGLLLSVFNLFSFIISIVIANSLYPVVSRLMRNEGSGMLYQSLKTSILDWMGGSGSVGEYTVKLQNEIISGLNLPEFMTGGLLENNNPVVYNALGVTGLEEYIAGYIANICINILAAILVFLIVFIIMKVISYTLDIVSRLPVINTFNKIGGVLAGVVQGTLVIWIICVVITFFFSQPSGAEILQGISDSVVASIFFENNLLMNEIMKFHLY